MIRKRHPSVDVTRFVSISGLARYFGVQGQNAGFENLDALLEGRQLLLHVEDERIGLEGAAHGVEVGIAVFGRAVGAEAEAAGDGELFAGVVEDHADEPTVVIDGAEQGAAAHLELGVSGRGEHKSFMEMTTEEWHRVLRVNLDGTFFTFRAAARHMAERAKNGDPGGRLVGTASLAAQSGAARGEHYAATKGGMVSMVYALAVELARYGITANSVLPGWIETEMTEKTFGWDKFAANVMPRIPARRWGTGEDFGGIAVYLMSNASSYHSGENFVIDGAYWRF